MQFTARLAVDIMDRNLYERANDCRWWALTTAFRNILAQPTISEDEQKELASILLYINELYTVYTNLYLYDNRGKIVAVSNPEESWMLGQYVDDETGAPGALKINDSQKYVVSEFAPTKYYQDRATYIYNAAVTDLNASGRVVGGIGIVFDSEPQFREMLTDALPKNEQGEVIQGCFGLFTGRNGKVISATEYSPVKTGETLSLDKQALLTLNNGESTGLLLEYQGNTYVVGACASYGYREYKTTGDYSNDVIGMVFLPL